MEEEIIDDWIPLDQNYLLLDKQIVQFQNLNIKKQKKIEESLENHYLKQLDQQIEETMKQLNYDDEQDQFEQDQLKKILKQEIFFDPLSDEKDQAFIKENMKKQFENETVLSCPQCFTQLCFDCQRHEKYQNQYRAIYVRNCKINSFKLVKPIEDESDIPKEIDIYFQVECEVCQAEVAVYELQNKIYHFYQTIAGKG